jgi:endonuclease III
MSNIDNTLAERKTQYGNYCGQSTISQALKNVMRSSKNWSTLTHDKKESLEMIVHKIARIINGNSNNYDSWHDIQGYAALISNDLQKETKKDEIKKSSNLNMENHIHSCSFYCTKPSCIEQQRNDLVQKYISRINDDNLQEIIRMEKKV